MSCSKMVAVVFVIGWGLGAAIVFGSQAAGIRLAMAPDPTEAEEAILFVIDLVDVSYFALGVTWAVMFGPQVFAVAPNVRKKILAIYLAICWLLMSATPHTVAHIALLTMWGIILLEATVHVFTVCIALVLIAFIYRLIKVAVNIAHPPGPPPSNKCFAFLRKDWVQMIMIGFPFFVIMFILGIPGNMFPAPPPSSILTPDATQEGILAFLSLFEALIFALAMAFVIKLGLWLRHLGDNRQLIIKTVPLVIAIWWILASWYFHGKAHVAIIDADAKVRPIDWIMLEIVFHLTLMVCGLALSYALFGIVQMAISYSKSPFRKLDSAGTASATRSDAYTKSGTVDTKESHADSASPESHADDHDSDDDKKSDNEQEEKQASDKEE